MRLPVLVACALFLSLPVFGQRDLKADLLSHAGNTQVVADLITLSEKTHEPSVSAIITFVGDLNKILGHRSLSDADAAPLVREIDAILKSAGTSTVGFHEHIAGFRAALMSAGASALDADKAAGDLEKIGRQVRGPEDTPIEPGPLRRR